MAVYLSIGENCMPQYLINDIGVSSFVTPFSWSRLNVDNLHYFLDTQFLDILDPSMYIDSKNPDRHVEDARNHIFPCQYPDKYIGYNTHFEWTHHQPFSNPADFEKLQNRVNRFIDISKNPDSVLIYYYEAFGPKDVDIEYISSRLNQLAYKIDPNGSKPKIIMIYRDPDRSANRIDMSISDRVIECKVMSKFFMNYELYERMDDQIHADRDLFLDMFSKLPNLIS